MTLLDRILAFFKAAPAEAPGAEAPEAGTGAVATEKDEALNTAPAALGAEDGAADVDDEADFASHMGEIVPLILEMAEPPASAALVKVETPPAALVKVDQNAPESMAASAPAEAAPSEESAGPAASPAAEPQEETDKAAEQEPAATAEAEPGGAGAPDEPGDADTEAASDPGTPPAADEPQQAPPVPEEPAESAPAEPPVPKEMAEPAASGAQTRIELPPFRQKRVVVSLLKGGVGKTTITCFLATALQKIWDDAAADGRVLVVDTDPQGSATDFFL